MGVLSWSPRGCHHQSRVYLPSDQRGVRCSKHCTHFVKRHDSGHLTGTCLTRLLCKVVPPDPNSAVRSFLRSEIDGPKLARPRLPIRVIRVSAQDNRCSHPWRFSLRDQGVSVLSQELDLTQRTEETRPPSPSVAAQRASVITTDVGTGNSLCAPGARQCRSFTGCAAIIYPKPVPRATERRSASIDWGFVSLQLSSD